MAVASMTRRMTRRAAVLGTLGAGLAGCLQLQETDDDATTTPDSQSAASTLATSERTATETSETTTVVENEVELTETWTSPLAAHAAAVGDAFVYAVRPDTGVVAFDRASGEEAWTVLDDHELGHISGYRSSRNTIVPTDRVHVLGRDSSGDAAAVFQFDAGGTEVARRDVDGTPGGIADTSRGVLLDVARPNDHVVKREDSSTHCEYGGGTVEWLDDSLDATASVSKPESVCRLTLLGSAGRYALFDGAYLRGVHGGTGDLWRRGLSQEDGVVAPDGRTFVASLNEGVLRLDPGDGSTKWSFSGYSGAGRLAVDDDSVYVAATGLAAIRSKDGRRRWRQSLYGNVLASPVVTDRGLWVLTDQSLSLFDTADGARLHQSKAPSVDGAVHFFATGSEVVVASEEGIRVYAVSG